MAITKEADIRKIEVVGSWNVQVATDTVIKEDEIEISRSRHRHVLVPYKSKYKTKEVDGVEQVDLDASGKTYIYAAWGDVPAKYSNGF